MKIWKYELTLQHKQELLIPKNRQKLSFQLQNGNPCLWVLVDEKGEKETVNIEMYGTDHFVEYAYDLKFLGTGQFGPLVFHFFERVSL